MHRYKYINEVNRAFFGGKKKLSELVPDNPGVFSSVFASLKYRNFKLYFSGQCVSLVGSWMQQIAISWLVYRLSGSVLLLATVTFMLQIPNLFFTPFTGVVTDRFDRRKILVITQSLAMVEAFVLAAMVFTNTISIPVIIALSLFLGIVNSFDAPARQTFYTRLVPKDHLGNAVALNSAVINTARMVGPALGGMLVALVGEGFCFLINGISFIAVIWALLAIKYEHIPPKKGGMRLFSEMKEGFVYVSGFLPIRALLLVVATVSFFGMPFINFMPAFAKGTLGGDSFTLGWLMSFVGLGAMSAAFYLAARKSVLGLGKVVTIAVASFGLGLIAISFVTSLWAALPFCFMIGFGMIATAASCNTLLQTLSDEGRRGRVMSYFTMAFFGIAPLGCLFEGAFEDVLGLPNIALISGVICLVIAGVFEYYRPVVRKYSRPVFARKGIVSEIAKGIDSAEEPTE